MIAIDEGLLVARAQEGDRAAMNELLTRHHPRIYAICRRMARNDADAADATQEALFAIVRGLPRFEGSSSFSTWSHRVATNACLDELRRRGRRPIPVDDQATPEPVATEPDVDTGVADRLRLDDALAELPEEFRAPVVLRDVVGLDYAEIADVLEIPPGTVRSRIARGRRHLARSLGESSPGGNQGGGSRRRNHDRPGAPPSPDDGAPPPSDRPPPTP